MLAQKMLVQQGTRDWLQLRVKTNGFPGHLSDNFKRQSILDCFFPAGSPNERSVAVHQHGDRVCAGRVVARIAGSAGVGDGRLVIEAIDLVVWLAVKARHGISSGVGRRRAFPTRLRYPGCQDRSVPGDLTAMIFDASHALRFINETRAATGLPSLTELPFTGAVRVDERGCLLARALQAEIGGSADQGFSGHFVVRLGDQVLARAVARRTGQPCNDRAEVLLPEPLARLAVAFDRGEVDRRDARYAAPGQLSFDDLDTAKRLIFSQPILKRAGGL